VAVENEFAWRRERIEQLQDSNLYMRTHCEAWAGYFALIDTGAPLVEKVK